MRTFFRTLLPLSLAAGALCSCDSLNNAVKSAAVDKGWVTQSQADGIQKSAVALRKSAADISESEEYFLGRSVSAQILGQYKPLADPRLNLYVRVLGQAMSMVGDRPATFVGYRFQVLDSAEPNAFAAPGGFIFVTKGLIDQTKSEDELAGVLAHEIAHVSLKHGLKTIRAARLTSAFSILAGEAAKSYTGDQLGKVTEAFEGSIDDVMGALVVNGYSRDKEYEADRLGAEYARRAGYDPRGLARVIARLKDAGGAGLMKTHPHPEFRLEKLKGVRTPAEYKPSPRRDARFKRSTASA